MLAPIAAVTGGVLLLVQALLGGSGPLTDTFRLLGLALLVLAAAIFGTGLVRSDARALKVVTGLASGLLALSMVEAFKPGTGDAPWYYGFWGAVALVIGGVALLRGRGREGVRPQAGSHAR